MPRLLFSPAQLEEKKAKAGDGHHGEVKSRRIDALLSRPRHPSYELYFLSRDLGAKDAFLFSEPRIPFDVSALKENNIEYVFLIDGLHQDDDPFYQTLQDQAELVMIFSPYLDQTDMIIRDSQAMTGGPFLWSDILTRKRNGYPISVYRIRS
jgi:polynucleotide 5'-kinase involved in rRNA processing